MLHTPLHAAGYVLDPEFRTHERNEEARIENITQFEIHLYDTEAH